MPVEFRKDSQWWYGRFQINGKRRSRKLRVEVGGVRPCAEYPDGDTAFIKSKGKAEDALDAHLTRIHEKKHAEEYVQELHRIRTGRRIESIPLAELADAWDKASRRRKGSKRYVAQAHAVFDRFVAFVAHTYRGTETLADVTPDMAEAFMRKERGRGLSGRTWNAKLILLRSAFRVLANQANLVRNPFDGIATRDEETAHRVPFNEKELLTLLAAAESEPFIRPVLLTGMCTAMRLGDCCRLKWSDVDLAEGFVRVKTSKTGETVEIPMFGLLRQTLQGLKQNGSEFLFPEQARMYESNPQGVSYRVRNLFKAAGFFDATDEKDKKNGTKERATTEPPAELLKRGLAALDALPAGAMHPGKRARMREAFELHMSGLNGAAVGRKMGLGKATISEYLRDMRELAGVKAIEPKDGRPSNHLGNVHANRKHGKRRASIRDFHSFRVTWITLALAAGVPLELVQRVTGHKTTQVVLKHYFKPGRDAFKKALAQAMPALLAGPDELTPVPTAEGEKTIEGQAVELESVSPSTALERAVEVLKSVTGKANQERVAQAVELIEKAMRRGE